MTGTTTKTINVVTNRNIRRGPSLITIIVLSRILQLLLHRRSLIKGPFGLEWADQAVALLVRVAGFIIRVVIVTR